MPSEIENTEIEEYNLRIRYAYHLHEAGLRIRYAYHLHEAGILDKSYITNKELAAFASQIGDLDLAECCYLRAIDDADEMNHFEDKAECMEDLARKVYLPWGRHDEAKRLLHKTALINAQINKIDSFDSRTVTSHYALGLGKEILNGFKDITDNDTNIKESLFNVRGLPSLVGIGINAAEKIHEISKSPGERASALLLKYILRSMHESIKDIVLLQKDKDFNKMDLMKILEPFEESSNLDSSDWNSYLPNHPVVAKIRSEVEEYLKKHYDDETIAKEFVRRFNAEIENKANENDDIKTFRQWWTIQQQNRDIIKYLEHVESMKYYALDLDKKPLNQYYIDHMAIWSEIKTWNWSDETILDQPSRHIMKARQIIKNELISKDEKHYLVIGASFGTGKTSMARMLVSEYASICLDEGIHNYIPILVFLKDEDFRVEYRQYCLDNLLENIIAPKKNEEASKRNILLILDGLDEYGKNTEKQQSPPLSQKLDELRNKYPNIKIIITTRLEDEILSTHRINVDKYVRLLSFSEDQLSKFFNSYGVIIDNVSPTYRHAKELNLPIEVMTKPLFAWIFSYLEMHSSPEFKIESKKSWSRNMIKTWIYLLFFHQVVQGRYKDLLGDGWMEAYVDEKKTLRRIAVLKQIYAEDLTWRVTEAKLRDFESTANRYDISSYFFYSRSSIKGKTVDFVHKSFEEYLLSEYYLECVLANKIKRLNFIVPSKDTIDFLDGLMGLLRSNDDSVKAFIMTGETSLLGSFDVDNDLKNSSGQQDLIFGRLTKVTKDAIVDEQIFLSTAYNEKSIDYDIENLVVKKYESLWIYRWISLCIFSHLHLRKKDRGDISSQKLGRLVKYSSNLMPYYLKDLRGLNLSNADLTGADLYRANLCGTDLSNANLVRTNLSKANLSNANLSCSDLSGADLSCATLDNAVLTDVLLWNTYLSDVELFKTDLSDAIIIDTDFSDVETSNAITEGTRIRPHPYPRPGDITICQQILRISPKVRFVGVFDTRTFTFQCKLHRKNTTPLLTDKDKRIILHVSWSGFKFRETIQKKVGKGLYVIEEYEKMKRITVPTFEGNLLYVTTDNDAILEPIIQGIHKELVLTSINPGPYIQYQGSWHPPVKKISSYQELCKEVERLELAKIRFIGICNKNGQTEYGGMRSGIVSKLNVQEREKSVRLAWKRWKIRRKFADKIGKGLYVMAVYEEMKRIIIPIDDNYLFLITAELEANHGEIIDHVLKLKSLLQLREDIII